MYYNSKDIIVISTKNLFVSRTNTRKNKHVYFKPVNSDDFRCFFKLVQTTSYQNICFETIEGFL